MLIGLAGLAGTGKTTCAEYLVERYGFSRHSLATPLKDMLKAIGLTDSQLNGDQKNEPLDLLSGRTARYAMQTLGTEWGRQMIHPEIWLHLWQENMPSGPVVIDDVRFPNECHRIKSLGGRLICVERPSLSGFVDAHESEAVASAWCDRIISNNGSVEQLHASLIDALEGLRCAA